MKKMKLLALVLALLLVLCGCSAKDEKAAAPTAAPATLRGTTFTATTPTVAKATGTDFTAPANAVAGTVSGGASFASAGFGALIDASPTLESGYSRTFLISAGIILLCIVLTLLTMNDKARAKRREAD